MTAVVRSLIANGRVVALLCAGLLLSSCGGSSVSSHAGDFSVSVSPSAISSQVGTTSSPVIISVTALNGFSGAVNITLQGIPAGVTVSPASSFFSLSAGATQATTLNLLDSASVGTTPVTVSATSGAQSHSAQIMLTAESIVRTFQIGTRLYLESGTATDTARVGLETTWGGSIVEVSVNGTEYVNRHDTGREVQPAFRSGSDINWNPTLMSTMTTYSKRGALL